MHTTPNTEPTLRDLQQVMIRVQINALETLERLMEDQKLTGNEKTDKAKATERNRQRMSATQTLIHCRTMQRELREKREQAHRIKQDERAAQSKAPHQLATLRRLHKQSPDEYDNPDTPSKGGMVGAEGAGHADNGSPVGSPPPSPLAGEGGRASDRMRGRPEPSDDQIPDGATGGSPASAGPPEPEPPTTPTPTPKRLTSFQIADAERKRQTRERIMAKHEAKMRPSNR